MNSDPFQSFAPELDQLIGQTVVVDTSGPFTYLGTLREVGPHSIVLADADVHDSRETSTTTERYLVESRRHGVRVNRRSVMILARRVISVSRLDDVLSY